MHGYVDLGDCLDIEKAAATMAQARAWVLARQKAGVARPWLYIDASQFAALEAAVDGLLVGFWVASWTGEAHSIEGTDAVQYANPPASGGDFDVSVVTGTLPCDYSPSAGDATEASAPAAGVGRLSPGG